MDKSKEKQIKRVFRRILNNLLKDIQSVRHDGHSPDVEDTIVNAAVSQLLKEVTIRTYVP